jgi:hypothetical protein
MWPPIRKFVSEVGMLKLNRWRHLQQTTGNAVRNETWWREMNATFEVIRIHGNRELRFCGHIGGMKKRR